MGIFDGSPGEQTYVILDLVGTVLSSIASVVTILVINKMKITGYIKLILTMTWFQFIYDVSFFNGTVDVGEYWIGYVANIFQLVGGLGSSLISNWIAYVVLYVVYNKRSIDIMRNYKYMLASAVIPAFVTAIVYSIGAIPQGNSQHMEDIADLGLYYYIRLVSIFLNFAMFGMASYFNHLIRSKGLGKSPSEQAINTLCRRLMYYPLLQAISRSGFAWYELQYGFNFEVSNCRDDNSCYAALIYATVITPTVSFGYLALFIAIEPHAYDHFRALFGLRPIKRNRDESKDTFSSAAHSIKSPSVADGASARSASDARSHSQSQSATEEHHTAETLSTNAYVERESSLYHMQNHSSMGWLGSSLYRKEKEEEDLRDEAALLETIDSECLPSPPSFSMPGGLGIAGAASSFSLPGGYGLRFPSNGTRSSAAEDSAAAANAATEGKPPSSLVGNLKSAMKPMFPGRKGKTVTLNLSLQSSTTSPIATMAGFRASEHDVEMSTTPPH